MELEDLLQTRAERIKKGIEAGGLEEYQVDLVVLGAACYIAGKHGIQAHLLNKTVVICLNGPDNSGNKNRLRLFRSEAKKTAQILDRVAVS
jgi:hypothetical protein